MVQRVSLRILQGWVALNLLLDLLASDFDLRFNRLAWGHVDATRPQGVIAAGLENGELALWDPAKIQAGARWISYLQFQIPYSQTAASASESLILRNATHTGP